MTMGVLETSQSVPESAFVTPSALSGTQKTPTKVKPEAQPQAAQEKIAKKPISTETKKTSPEIKKDTSDMLDGTPQMPAFETKTSTRVEPTAATPPAPAMTRSLPENLSLLTPEVLRIAQALSDGRLMRLEITADMVGGTLLYDGDVHFVTPQGATPKAPAASAVLADPGNVAASKLQSRGATGHAVRTRKDDIMRIMRHLPDDWMNLTEIASLFWEDEGFKSVDTCRASLVSPAKELLKEGLIEKMKVKHGSKYRLAKNG